MELRFVYDLDGVLKMPDTVDYYRFALIGKNIEQSLSPFLHNSVLRLLAEKKKIQKAYYYAINVSEERLGEAIQILHSKKFQGVNITAPYKQAVLAYVDTKSSICCTIGASNTLLWKKQGYVPYNTDGVGLVASLQDFWTLKEKNILLLGAGGAAKGLIYSLLEAGVASIHIYNRGAERLKELSCFWGEHPRIRLNLLPAIDLQTINCIINATSVLLNPDEPICLKNLPRDILIYDIVYSEKKSTPWVDTASSYGFLTKNGWDMLKGQAAAAMAIWLNTDVHSLYSLYKGIG